MTEQKEAVERVRELARRIREKQQIQKTEALNRFAILVLAVSIIVAGFAIGGLFTTVNLGAGRAFVVNRFTGETQLCSQYRSRYECKVMPKTRFVDAK